MQQIALSNRQAKNADRVGGIELMLPWPAELAEPVGLGEDQERDASPQERAWAEAHVQPAAQQKGLVLVRVAVARVRPPSAWVEAADRDRWVNALACIIIGQRWLRAGGAPAPLTMWWTK